MGWLPNENRFFKAVGWGIALFLVSLVISWQLNNERASNLELLSKAEKAIELARQKEDSPAGKTELALAYYARYEESENHKFLERAIRLLKSVKSADIPTREYLLGVMYLDLKQEKLALKNLESFLQNNSDNQQAQLARGIALIKLGRYQKSIDALTTFAKVKPGIADTYELLGQAYQMLGREEQARQARHRAKLLLGRTTETGSNNGVTTGDKDKNHE